MTEFVFGKKASAKLAVLALAADLPMAEIIGRALSLYSLAYKSGGIVVLRTRDGAETEILLSDEVC